MRYEDVVLRDGPIAYWPLTETTGTTAVNLGSSGTSLTHTGVIVGSAPFPAGGRAAHYAAASTAKSTGYTPNSAGWTGAALEAWYRLHSSGSSATIRQIGGVDGASSNFYLRIGDGATLNGTMQGVAYNGSGVTVITGGKDPDLGGWHHAALVWTGTRLALFRDGRFVTDTALATTGLTTGLTIGESTGFAGRYFDGFLAHFALYPATLPASRIAAHYRAGRKYLSA